MAVVMWSVLISYREETEDGDIYSCKTLDLGEEEPTRDKVAQIAKEWVSHKPGAIYTGWTLFRDGR